MTELRRAGPTLIAGGRVIDPANGKDAVADVLVSDGVVREVADRIPANAVGEHGRLINAAGLVVSPGFIDIHAHLREPGYEYKETIVTGAAAAARGGFTTICAMPNTDPAVDNEAVVELVNRRAANAVVRVRVIGCVSRNRAGRESWPTWRNWRRPAWSPSATMATRCTTRASCAWRSPTAGT